MADKYTNINNDVAGIENLTKFDTFFRNRYLDPFVSGYGFVFITKPSLFIYPYKPTDNDPLKKMAYNNMVKHSKFSQFLIVDSMNESDKLISKQLSYFEAEDKGAFSSNYSRSNFLPIFTNRNKSFSATDITLDTHESYETKQGFRMVLPTHTTQSEAANTFGLSCIETANLDITKTLSLWVNYISNVTDGTFQANPEMIKSGVLDYMSSVYYFVLEPDGRTLKYWAKYTGCYPTNIPYGQMSYSRGEQALVEVEANFAYMSKEDMDPEILEDFNKVSMNFFGNNSIDINTVISGATETDYVSIRESKYLTKEGLKEILNRSTDGIITRGPLVYYHTGSDATRSNKFELSFGQQQFEGNFERTQFKEDYFFSQESFFKSTLDERSTLDEEETSTFQRLNSDLDR
jgi:hypothetical protein